MVPGNPARHIILLRKDPGSRQGTVSTDNYQSIDVLFLYDLINFLCVLREW